MKIVYINVTPQSNLTADSPFTKVQISCLLIFAIIALVLLVIMLRRRMRENLTLYNDLYINLIACSLLCACVARPMTLLQGIVSFVPRPSYCTAYVFVLEIETVTIPLAMLMLTIERVVYFKSIQLFTTKAKLESHYRKQLPGRYRVLMLTLPWAVGFFLAFIKTFGLLNPIEVLDNYPGTSQLDTNYVLGVQRHLISGTASPVFGGMNNTNITLMDNVTVYHNSTGNVGASHEGALQFKCHLTGRSDLSHLIGEGILYTCRSSFPLIYLAVSWAFMLMAWWKAYDIIYPELKWQREHDEEHEEQEQQAMTQQSNEEGIHGEASAQAELVMRTFSFRSATTCQCGCPLDLERFLERRSKTYVTVWVGGILTLWCMAVAFIGSLLCKLFGWLVDETQWLYFSLEFTMVYCACTHFPEVRKTLFCREVFCAGEEKDSAMRARRRCYCHGQYQSLEHNEIINNNGNATRI